MLPNDSNAAVPLSTAGYLAIATAPGADVADIEVRWANWRTRGIAHERAVRRKLTLVGAVAGSVAIAVAIAYSLL